MAQAGRAAADELDEAVRHAQRSSLFVSLGTLLATVTLVLGLLALSAAYTGAAASGAVPWVIVLMASAAAMGLLCVVQLRLWNLAWRRWLVPTPTPGLERVSWVLHLLSYVVVLVGIFAGVAASQAVGLAGSVATLSTLALVPLVAAQALGAVQHVRRGGPAGTVPTHIRAIAARVERSRHED